MEEFNINRKLVYFTYFILMSLLVACSNSEKEKDVLFVGESENWRVILDVERLETEGSSLNYTISYTGEGSKPDSFFYEIEPKSPSVLSGEGSFEHQDEWTINSYGDTEPVFISSKFPMTINWDGKEEDLVVKSQR